MTTIYMHGHIRPESSFWGLFPDNNAPLVFPYPFHPDRPEAPPCYMVDGSRLDENLLRHLAETLMQVWNTEIQTIEDAIAYVRTGLPLECRHFSSVSFNDRSWLTEDDYDYEDEWED